MASITLRESSLYPLSNAQVDGNFTSLNNAKVECTEFTQTGGVLATFSANANTVVRRDASARIEVAGINSTSNAVTNTFSGIVRVNNYVYFTKSTSDTSQIGLQYDYISGNTSITANTNVMELRRNGSTGNLMVFYSGGTAVGTISTNGTTTTYGTTSDHRLKTNVKPMTGGLATVSYMNPVTFDWVHDGSPSQGFIAHELQALIPDAVTGQKDQVDAEGNPVYQNVDTSFVVATLTSAIKELKEIVESQQQQINELKAQLNAG